MSTSRTLFSKSGGPGYLLPGFATRTGSEEVSRNRSEAIEQSASCALRASGQQVARTTKKIIAPVFIGLFLTATPLAHAQDAATNAPTTDTAPAVTPAPPITTTPTPQIVPTDSLAAAKPDEIDDIRPPFFFLHFWPFVLAGLVLLALIGLAILVWKWLSKSPYLSPKSAYDLTLEKLEKARALLREDDPVPYAVFVSEAIRSYLGQRFQTPSTRRTTEEFLRMMEADPDTPLAAHSDLLRQFLQACDLVKFAKYQPTQAELEEVQQRAFSFVHATNPMLDEPVRSGGKP